MLPNLMLVIFFFLVKVKLFYKLKDMTQNKDLIKVRAYFYI